ADLIKYPFKIIHYELGIKCRFYDLRGSFATTTLRSGVEIKDISKVLGHSKIETTENYYITSTIDTLKNVSETFEKEISLDYIIR
ncbi:MAG: tyrosine-type recombinase/integrase, partial [Bacilli bacterium]